MSDEKATPFMWKGDELATIGDLMDAMSAIMRIEDVEGRQHTATAFMQEYSAVNEHAGQNIGYLCGYFGHDQMVEGLRLFATSHPIFGKALGEAMKRESQN